jgi:hypothetical protein
MGTDVEEVTIHWPTYYGQRSGSNFRRSGGGLACRVPDQARRLARAGLADSGATPSAKSKQKAVE